MPPTPILTHKQFIYILFFCLLTACTGGEQQRLQLKELERMNRTDSLMLNDSLALTLAQWFDRHGTPNEQLRAYYMLGRTYADRGETPQALEAYHDAIDRADTTSADCNYYTLCRVYSQMANIFYQQNLISENLRFINLSIACAYKDCDTITALKMYGQKLLSFEKLDQNDSIIFILENVYKSFSELGYPDIASRYLSYGLMAYTIAGNYDKAKWCLDNYESKSGYFTQNIIESGREAFYSLKGDYYLAIEQYDSAEYYYRKELLEGPDYNNQTLAAQGLSKLYTSLHLSDSAAKYATYAYTMNDSNHYNMATTEIEQIQAMYNYSRHQRIAQQEKRRADFEKNKAQILLLIIILLSFLTCTIFYLIRKKRRKEHEDYIENIRELEFLQSEMLLLQSHEAELGELLNEKEILLNDLKRKVDAYQLKEKHSKVIKQKLLNDSVEYKALKKKAIKGSELTVQEWHELNRLVIDVLPEFYHFITAEHCNLSINEYRVVVLIRLHISPMVISNMMNVSPPYISKVITNLSYKLYQDKLYGKTLEQHLSELF